MTLASSLTSALLSWYDTHGRDLPWRDHPDPYAVLISEFMLQQTTVPAVLPYFKKWVDKYPTIDDLASADEGEVLRDWEGLGYYSRARNLHTAAREVVRQYGGIIPDGPDNLKELPGIGDYTAAAVASIAFGARVPALDANNLRVWSRLLASSEKKRIARVFARVLPADRPGDFNQALMDLGSAVCTPSEPRCLECPLSNWCRAHRTGHVDKYPEKKSRPETVRVEAAIGIIVQDGKVLVQKRPETGLLAGLWEFPGGKLNTFEPQSTRRNAVENNKSEKNTGHKKTEKAASRKDAKYARKTIKYGKNMPSASTLNARTHTQELPEVAVVREVREETGLRVQVCGKLGIFNHSYTRFRVRLHVFLCRKKAGKLHRPEAMWVTLEELERLPMPSANRRIVKALEKNLDAETR